MNVGSGHVNLALCSLERTKILRNSSEMVVFGTDKKSKTDDFTRHLHKTSSQDIFLGNMVLSDPRES